MRDRAIAKESDREAGRARRNKLHPLGRMTTPDDIAESIFFLKHQLQSRAVDLLTRRAGPASNKPARLQSLVVKRPWILDDYAAALLQEAKPSG